MSVDAICLPGFVVDEILNYWVVCLWLLGWLSDNIGCEEIADSGFLLSLWVSWDAREIVGKLVGLD